MNKNVKEILKSAAESPDSIRKDVFIREYRKKYNSRRTNTWDIVKSQVGYIRPSVWIVSVAALFLAVLGIQSDRDTLFIVAAMMPFVSGTAIIESFRARQYRLSELEGTTLFSTKGILFTRIVCIGSVHIALITLLTIIIGSIDEHGLLMTGAALTIPYLFSSVVSMELERTELGRKNTFLCMGIAALTAGMVVVVKGYWYIFDASYQWVLVVTTFALIVIEFVEIRKLFHWEEYAWS